MKSYKDRFVNVVDGLNMIKNLPRQHMICVTRQKYLKHKTNTVLMAPNYANYACMQCHLSVVCARATNGLWSERETDHPFDDD